MINTFIEYDHPLESNETITLVYDITLNSGDTVSVSSTSSEVSFTANGYIPGVPTPQLPLVELMLDRLQIVSCDDIVTLHAHVLHEVPQDQYQWYQISGLLVEWLTPTNDLTVMFLQTSVKDDKVFTLYVNEGTNSEVSASILVTAVPRDDIVGFTHAPRPFSQPYADEQVAISHMIPGLSASGTVTVNNPLRGVMFNSPNVTYTPVPYYNLITNLLVYDVTGGLTETLLASIPGYSTGYFSFPSTRSVRVDTVVVNKQADRVEEHHVAKGIPAGFFPGYMDMDTFDPAPINLTGGSSLKQTFSNIVYTKLISTYETTLEFSLLDSSAGLYNKYQRYPLSLKILDPTPDDSLLFSLLNGESYQTYHRLDLGVGGLGDKNNA